MERVSFLEALRITASEIREWSLNKINTLKTSLTNDINDTNNRVTLEVSRLDTEIDGTNSVMNTRFIETTNYINEEIKETNDTMTQKFTEERSYTNTKATELNIKINTEITDRTNAITTVTGLINDEITNRTNDITDVNNRIDSEVATIDENINATNAKLNNEINNRVTAINTTTEYINEQIANVNNEISETNTKLNTEISDRQTAITNTTTYIDEQIRVTKEYADFAVAAVVNSAPEVLNTLSELSAALGNDENFSITMTNEISKKVDKVDGFGLSSNDYTSAEKNKLADIEVEANKTITDAVLNSSSTNPIQNKAVNEAISDINTAITELNELIDILNNLVGATSVSSQIGAAIENKVDKVDGKELSTNDLTDELKGYYDMAYAHSQEAHATMPGIASTDTLGLIKVGEGLIIDQETGVLSVASADVI